MNVRYFQLISLFVLTIFSSQQLNAYLAGEPIKMKVDIVVNTVDGETLTLCQNSVDIERAAELEWSIAVAGGHGQPENTAQSLVGRVNCKTGPEDIQNPAPGVETEAPGFLISGKINARINRKMEDERVVAVNITSSTNTGKQTEKDESTGIAVSGINREFFFTENRHIFIPLLVANDDQKKSLGVQDVFLKIGMKEQIDEQDSVYGVIKIESDLGGADVFMDGGHAGEIPDSGHLLLRNVKVGMHKLEIGKSDQVLSRKTLRVAANRTTLALVNTEQEMLSPYQLQALGENEQGYQEFRRTIDGAVVIKVPEGEFLMGNSETERSPLEHFVYLSNFLMDKLGVTWGQYKMFTSSTGIPLPPHDPYWGMPDDQPAVYVTWDEAKNYCEWAGARLPTEAEREKAARGSDGRKFPWGNEEPTPELGVFRKSWGYEGPAPVGSLTKGASPYGFLDVGGNVWEWCADWYDGDYYGQSPYRNPKGPAMGNAHVVRGGSWDSRPTVLSSSCRSWGHRGYRDGDFGFRCAMNSQE